MPPATAVPIPIQTRLLTPHEALTPYVSSYSLREFNTKGADMIKPWHACHEMSLIFFFKDKPLQLKSAETGAIIKRGTLCDIVGASSRFNGDMLLRGDYRFFEIVFRLGGLYGIFPVTAGEFLNRIVTAEDLFGRPVLRLAEQLNEAASPREMARLTDDFLLRQLARRRPVYHRDVVNTASRLITRHAGIIDLAVVARETGTSIRTLERKFTGRAGIPPKLLSCIARFNHAFSRKLRSPRESWTSIAMSCGYFDQMHLIREFKRFSGSAPSSFFRKTPLSEEQFTVQGR